MRVLIVDDEPNIRRTLRIALEAMGHAVEEASTGREALRRAEGRPFDVALVDLRLGEESGLDLLEPLLAQSPRLAIVLITAYASIESAMEAMRRGAFDYLPKPFTPAQVRAMLERVAKVRGLRDRVADLEDRVRAEVPEVDLQGRDPEVRRVLEMARRVAPFDAAVLLRGENGTGKGVLRPRPPRLEQAARRPVRDRQLPEPQPRAARKRPLRPRPRGLHRRRPRRRRQGRRRRRGHALPRRGRRPPARRSSPSSCGSSRSGSTSGSARPNTRSADVRLVAATNRDLEALVASGAFREDLLYRLNVVEMTLPPLRKRADVAELADHLLAFFARQVGRQLTGFTPEAAAALARHAWPGNLRELRNAVERAAILAEGPEIGLADLPERIVPHARRARPGDRGRPAREPRSTSRPSTSAGSSPAPPAARRPRGSSGSTPARSTASGSNTGSDESRDLPISPCQEIELSDLEGENDRCPACGAALEPGPAASARLDVPDAVSGSGSPGELPAILGSSRWNAPGPGPLPGRDHRPDPEGVADRRSRARFPGDPQPLQRRSGQADRAEEAGRRRRRDAEAMPSPRGLAGSLPDHPARQRCSGSRRDRSTPSAHRPKCSRSIARLLGTATSASSFPSNSSEIQPR